MQPLRDCFGDNFNLIEFVNADLMDQASINDAAIGCKYIVLVSTPVESPEPKNPDDVILPAVNGTEYVMKAAVANGVKRVVLTSSTAAVAILPSKNYPREITDQMFSAEKETKEANMSYCTAKLRQETLAWELEKQLDVELVVILPGYVLGEFIGHTGKASTGMIEQMMLGNVSSTMKVVYPCSDIDIVSLAHYRALITPEAAGRRFIVCQSNSYFLSDLTEALKQGLNENGYTRYKLPQKETGYCHLQCLAMCNPQYGLQKMFYGRVITFDNSPAKEILGLEFRKNEKDMVTATALTLIRKGIVPDKKNL